MEEKVNIKKPLFDFVIVFLIALAASVTVTFLWNLIFYGAGAVDWETAFRFAIILGIVLSWMKVRDRKESER